MQVCFGFIAVQLNSLCCSCFFAVHCSSVFSLVFIIQCSAFNCSVTFIDTFTAGQSRVHLTFDAFVKYPNLKSALSLLCAQCLGTSRSWKFIPKADLILNHAGLLLYKNYAFFLDWIGLSQNMQLYWADIWDDSLSTGQTFEHLVLKTVPLAQTVWNSASSHKIDYAVLDKYLDIWIYPNIFRQIYSFV